MASGTLKLSLETATCEAFVFAQLCTVAVPACTAPEGEQGGALDELGGLFCWQALTINMTQAHKSPKAGLTFTPTPP